MHISKHLIRIVSIWLVVCLMADPATVSVFVYAKPRSTKLLSESDITFTEQALSPIALEGHQKELGEHVPFWNRLAIVRNPTLWGKQQVWRVVEPLLRHAGTSNFHRHTSGSYSPESLAQAYVENKPAVEAFQRYYGPKMDPTNPEVLKSLMLLKNLTIQGLFKGFESAFIPGKILLAHDTADFQFTRRWFKELLLDSAHEGNRWMGIRSTFDAHHADPSAFRKAVETAVEGLLEAEVICQGGTKGVLFLAIRKTYTPEHAEMLVNQWLDLRESWMKDKPHYAAKLAGIDSIMSEHNFNPYIHTGTFRRASREGQILAFHSGEEWAPGKMQKALQRISYVLDVKEGAPVTFLTNPLALFIDPDSLSSDYYSDSDKKELHSLQAWILNNIRSKKIILEISPSSNKFISQTLRTTEKSKFFSLDDPRFRDIRLAITDDDGGLIDTTFIEELRRLYFGAEETAYGSVSTRTLIRLILNSRAISRTFERSPFPNGNSNGLTRMPNLKIKKNLEELQEERLRAHEIPGPPGVAVYGGVRLREGTPEYAQGEEIGNEAEVRGMRIITGGGPGAGMEAPMRGARKAREAAGKEVTASNANQSIRIKVPHELVNPYADLNEEFNHFVPRKEALHDNAEANMAVPGGFGTWDEIFEVLRLDLPIALLGRAYYGPSFKKIRHVFEEEGIFNHIRNWPLITDSVPEAFDHNERNKHTIRRPNRETVERGNRELEIGLKQLDRMPPAVTFIGKPNPQSPSLAVIKGIAATLLNRGQAIRCVSRGPVFQALYETAKELGKLSSLQCVFFISEKEGPLTEQEQELKTQIISTKTESIHQILMTKCASAFVYTPGGWGTLNKLYDSIAMIQNRKMDARPILFVGRNFGEAVIENIMQSALHFRTTVTVNGGTENIEMPLITPGRDERYVHIIDTVNEGNELLGLSASKDTFQKGPKLSIPMIRDPLQKAFEAAGMPTPFAEKWSYRLGTGAEELRQLVWDQIREGAGFLTTTGMAWGLGVNLIFAGLHLAGQKEENQPRYGNLSPAWSLVLKTVLRTLLGLTLTGIFAAAQQATEILLPTGFSLMAHWILPLSVSYVAHLLINRTLLGTTASPNKQMPLLRAA